MLPMISAETTLPATRMMKSSPRPESKTISGATRESLQTRIVAKGFWPSVSLAMVSGEKAALRDFPSRNRRFPSTRACRAWSADGAFAMWHGSSGITMGPVSSRRLEPKMRILLACLLAAFAHGSVAQLNKDLPKQPSAASAKCADCGVVSSVRTKTKELRGADTTDDARGSGLVASVPLGKGGGKPVAGSSTKIGKDAVPTSQSWEIIVRLDDGRMRVLNVTQPPEVREGDKVRVEPNGKLTLGAA